MSPPVGTSLVRSAPLSKLVIALITFAKYLCLGQGSVMLPPMLHRLTPLGRVEAPVDAPVLTVPLMCPLLA